MAFTFENFRNLFSGHKSEPLQLAFSPASGRDLEQVHDQLGNAEARQETTVPETPISSQAQEKHPEEQRQEFGTIYQTNVMLPDGSLGHSERRSRFEISEREDNQFDLTLISRRYLYSGMQLVSERDLTQGMYGPSTYGPFLNERQPNYFATTSSVITTKPQAKNPLSWLPKSSPIRTKRSVRNGSKTWNPAVTISTIWKRISLAKSTSTTP